jgi:hypothetical protein
LWLPRGDAQLCEGGSKEYFFLGEGGSEMERDSMQIIRQHQATSQALKLDQLTNLTREVRTSKSNITRNSYQPQHRR